MLQKHGAIRKEKHLSFIKVLERKIMQWMRLTREPVVKVYNGYGHNDQMIIYGHVLNLSPLPRKRFSRNKLYNVFSLLRLFMVKPAPDAHVRLHWKGETHTGVTGSDGFFRIEWKPSDFLSPGWHPVQVELMEASRGGLELVVAMGEGMIFHPHKNRYACISDIDDTFLISHSKNLRKRLYVLLTKNAHSRKPFADVVNHYQLLCRAGTSHDTPNPFFYVSSSEWNLYNYIKEFTEKNHLPKGVYLLSQLKKFKEVFKTGQNKHATKFMRISRIIESYPGQQFILLGDDTQEDPVIYASVAEHFPGKIRAVYLRHVHRKHLDKVTATVKRIEAAGVECCYFEHSAEAIEHSKHIGLIDATSY